VEIENIVRHMRQGKPPYKAAMEAADEIGLAVVATSATIIAVFLPVSFMTGVTGQFFKEFGITVAIAVFISLLVARLITPMMAAHFLRFHGESDHPGRLRRAYEKTLAWAIGNPWKAVAAGLTIWIVSLVMAFHLPVTFIPRIDNGAISLSVEFPPGTPLMEADKQLQALVRKTRGVKEIESYFTSISGTEGAVSSASVNYKLVPREKRDKSAYQVQQELRPLVSTTPDVRATFQNFQGGGRGADITVQLVSDDPTKVEGAADKLVSEMKALPELADVRSSASLKRPEIQITPKPDEAARLGVSAAAISSAVRIATSGDIDQNLAKFNLSDRQIPIRVLLRPDARADLETIRSMRVRTSTGDAIRLDSVANVKFGLGETTIERRDRQRMVTVSANVVKGEIGAATGAVMSLPAARTPDQPARGPGAKKGEMPEGVALVAAGSTEDMQEFFGQFAMAMLWGFLLIYGVLVLLFRDFFQPITILTAFPLSIGGAVLGLLITGQPFSMFVGIGLIMLMGIVTKNSILLVDFAIEMIHGGMNRTEALLEAGKKRARPIVMTTIAMSAGMIPAAAGLGVDGSLRQGMGAAVIGGLLLSTMLSLVFVPAVFVLISKLENWVKPLFSRFSSTAEEHQAAHTPAE
jgi:HAE1 family hydrophobic/amphiphilic exporter-1